QPQLFSNAADLEMVYDQTSEQFMKDMNNGNPHLVTALTAMDPPMHTQYRDITSGWFSPANIRKLEENIRGIARKSVDRLFSYDGECDFLQDCALYYPLHVVMAAFGVPEEDEPKMLQLTQEFFGAHDPEERRGDLPTSPEAAAQQWHATIND